MTLRQTLGGKTWAFEDLRQLMAKATPLRSGDVLAGLAAETAEEGVAARMLLADQPLRRFLAEPLVSYEADEVTRLICDTHDAAAFAPIASLTVGEFRDFLLAETTDGEVLAGTDEQSNLNTVVANHHIWFDQNLAVVPPTNPVPAGIPEPATWAMMIGGLGAVGMTLRRRRTSASHA